MAAEHDPTTSLWPVQLRMINVVWRRTDEFPAASLLVGNHASTLIPFQSSRPTRQLHREKRVSGYPFPVSSQRVPGGVVHKLPADLREALIDNSEALAAWKDITPLARNEFICWVEDAKQEVTRKRRIRRTQEELEEGQRRPCCWPGCKHRERTGR
jgi:Bacteriocin-protection, YdeI or OmpD-Associated